MRHIWYYYGSPVKNQMNYFPTAFKGASWFSALRIITRGLTIVKIAILARLLLPSQFGEFGIATILLGLLEIFTETGINVFLLQEKSDPEKYVDTAWAISIIRGLVISFLILLTAPLVSQFFRATNIIPLIYLISLVPFIRGFINPLIVKFQKNLLYRQEFTYRSSIIITESVVIIVLAYLTHSVYSFAWGLIVSAIVEVIISHLFINPRPRLDLNLSQTKLIITRGKWVTGYGIMEYVYTQSDNIVVGRFLGQTSLGIYQNAYKLSVLPLTEIGEVFYKVTFPIFMRLTQYPARLKKAALKSSLILVSLLLVSSFILFYFAQPIISIFLGPNWQAAVPVVKILAFLGLLRGLGYSFNSLFFALKKQHYVTIITTTSAAGLLASIIPLVNNYGLLGAAYSAMIGAALSLIPAAHFVWISMRELSRK